MIAFEKTPSSGNVIKGPLHHALVFLDINGDSKPIDEPFAYTKSDGSYDLLEAFRNQKGTFSTEEMENANLTVFTYDNTVDTISDKPLPDVILKAPFGSNVISPLTTIMSEANLSSAEVANLFNMCAVSIPLKKSKNNWLSLSILSNSGNEEKLLCIAEKCENIIKKT